MFDTAQPLTFRHDEPDNLSQTLVSLRKWKAPMVTLTINNIILSRYLSRGGIEGCDFSGLDLHGVNILPYINGDNTEKKTNFDRTNVERKNFFYTGPTKGILQAKFSHNDKLIVTISYDDKICVWDSKTGFLRSVYVDKSLSPSSVGFSPDDETIAVAGLCGKVVFFDSTSLKEMGEVLICKNDKLDIDYYLTALSYNINGEYLAVSSNDNNVYILDVNNYVLTRTLSSHKFAATCVTYSPDGKMFASTSDDRSTIIRDTANYKIIKQFIYTSPYSELDGSMSYHARVAFSPNSDRILVTTGDQKIVCWSVANNHKPMYEIGPYKNFINSIDISPCGNHFAVSIDDNVADIYDFNSGSIVKRVADIGRDLNPSHIDNYPFNTHINSAVYNSSGTKLLFAIDDKTARIYNCDKFSPALTIEGFSATIVSVALDKTNRICITATDNKIYLWKQSDSVWRLQNLLSQSTGEITILKFSKYGGYLIAASLEGSINIYNASDNFSLTATAQHSDRINHIATSNDEKFVITVSDDFTACIWELATGKQVRKFQFEDAQYAADFCSDDKLVAIGSENGNLNLYDWKNSELAIEQIKDDNSVFCAKFDYVGKYLAYGYANGVVVLFDLYNSQITKFDEHKSEVSKIYFNLVNTMLLTLSEYDDKRAVLWNIEEKRIMKIFESEEGGVSTTLFSNNCEFILVVYEHGVAEIINIETLSVLWTIEEHRLHSDCISFSADDKRVFAVVDESYVYVYSLEVDYGKLKADSILDNNYNPKLEGCTFNDASFDDTFNELDIMLLRSYDNAKSSRTEVG